MSTFMANKGNIERKWYVIDAAGKPMGKTAVAAADLLCGNEGGLVPQLPFNSLHQSVQHGGSSVHHAAAHTVHCVLSDDMLWLVQTGSAASRRPSTASSCRRSPSSRCASRSAA